MRTNYKYILTALCLIIGFFLKAETENIALNDSIEAWDNSAVDYRHPSADTIAYYKQLPEYSYVEIQEPESIWQKLWNWLMSLLIVGGYMSWIGWLILVLAVLALLAIIIRLFGIPIKGLFIFSRSTKVTDLNFSSGDGDLEGENLEELLKNFISGGAFREATRVLFLLALRQLNRNKLIKWHTWKTDREYYYEIKDEKLKADFLNVMRQYEFIWYGKFNPESDHFIQLNKQFEQLSRNIETINN